MTTESTDQGYFAQGKSLFSGQRWVENLPNRYQYSVQLVEKRLP